MHARGRARGMSAVAHKGRLPAALGGRAVLALAGAKPEQIFGRASLSTLSTVSPQALQGSSSWRILIWRTIWLKLLLSVIPFHQQSSRRWGRLASQRVHAREWRRKVNI